MGDVFDAMNRSGRGGEQDPDRIHRAEDGGEGDGHEGVAEDAASTSRHSSEEQPGLPIDQIDTRASGYDEAPAELSTSDPRMPIPDRTVAAAAAKADEDRQVVELPPSDERLDDSDFKGYSDEVVVHHDRGSAITEQYRAIRTQVLARARNRRLQTHLITSSAPGEGKSVSTVNLGVVFSELQNQKTLLIEADLRRPIFSYLFDRESQPGLLQLLRGELTEVEQAVHKTAYENLQFIPAGGRDSTHSTELLSSPRMVQILDRLRDRYDHIFIDSPPVVSVTDAAILGSMCDQTMMVVRLNRTPVEMVDRAKRLLRAANCEVAGVILSHMKVPLMRYMHRSRYYYGASYN